jgi:amino acid permease
VLVWLAGLLPLSLVEKISHLQWPSLFGVAAVVYLVLSVVAHAGVCAFGEVTMAAAAAAGDAGASGGRSPMNSSTFDLAAGGAGLRRFAGGEDGRMRLWAWGPSSLEAIAIALFAFTCQVNVPALLAELEDEEGGAGGAGGAADEDGDSDDDAPAASASASAAAGKASSETPAARRRRSRASPMKQVSLRAMCICLSCYILVGLAGYRDAPSSPNGNLLKNYCIVASPHSLIPTHTSSRLMAPASLAMAVSVLMAYPFNIHPCRYTLDVMCFRHFGAVRSAVRHVVWTLLISGTSLLASLYIPGINIVFQLMGSTCSAFVCFILPAAFGLRLGLPEAGGPYRTPVGTAACVALLVGGAAIGVLATASTIAGLMAGEDAAKEAARAALPDVCDRHACRA